MILAKQALGLAASVLCALALAAPAVQAQEACISATSDVGDFVECLKKADGSRAGRCASVGQVRLLPPVAGTTMLSFGQKTQFGTVSKGIVVQAEAGAEVRAPAGGMVLFAQQWRTYGMLIVIDACTIDVLVAGVHSTQVQPGTSVKSGDSIARMVNAPGAVLYYEVRANGRAADPAPLQAQ